jgi:hypothetical protein
MIIVGIDPGLTGALAVINDHHKPLAICDLPTMPIPEAGPKATIKREIDVRALYALLCEVIPEDDSCIAVMEHASSIGAETGEMAKLSLAATKASIMAVLRLKGLDVRRVAPVTWKRHFRLSKEKNAALDLARSMFMFPPELKRALDHNRAEALLIASFGKSRFA